MIENASYEFEFLPKGHLIVKKCSKCNSIYIDKESCDVCGFQIAKNYLGKPIGINSFYEMKESFLNERPFYQYSFPLLENVNSPRSLEFKKFLFKRLRGLLYQLANDEGMDSSDKKLFFIELRDVVKELYRFETDYKKIWNAVNEFAYADFYRSLVSLMVTAEKEQIAMTKKSLFNKKILGTIRLKVVATLILLSSSLSIVSYQAFLYLSR